jgi:hypothetical protein
MGGYQLDLLVLMHLKLIFHSLGICCTWVASQWFLFLGPVLCNNGPDSTSVDEVGYSYSLSKKKEILDT